MIKFVMVEPNIEVSTSYFDQIENNLKTEKTFIKTCNAYLNEELQRNLKIDTDDNIYFIELELATFNSSKHLFVSVEPQRIGTDFDKDLYNIKFKLKNLLRKDWKECVWLLDEQSSQYANELYLEIHKLENDLRQFINILMIRHFGIDWWNVTPKKIKDKYNGRYSAYKRVAKLYANVSDKLLSIDTDDLILIMTHQVKKFDDNHTPSIIGILDSLKETGDLPTVAADYNRIVRELRQACVIEIDLWKEIFSKYFSEEFISQWKDFSKNRNHVAHNKLLDTEAYKTILDSISLVKNSLDTAQSNFNKISISDEQKELFWELDIMKHHEEAAYELARKEEEAGINILDTDSILELFKESSENALERLSDSLYFRNDLEIKTSPLTEDTQDTPLLVIKSKLNNNKFQIIGNLKIDEDSGSQSFLDLTLLSNESCLNEFRLTYQNGEAVLHEDENYYLPDIQDEFNDDDLTNVIEEASHEINVLFPDLVDEVNSLTLNDGGISVVAELPCEECGEEYVSINDAFYEKGKCVNCGHSHSINKCERCEFYYNKDLEGDSMFCNSCLEWFDEQ
ncbi:MAG: hypothetical protein ACQEV0_04075 [Bacillota bacterium]